MHRWYTDAELTKIFGADIRQIDRAGGGDDFAGASRRVRRLAARGRIVRHELKPGLLITPRPTWPPMQSPGLVLTAMGASADHDGKKVFSYVPNAEYVDAQEMYEQAQATYDPRHIMALLQRNPWHGDSLLSMADLHRSTGDPGYADELVEMCVYALERGWPVGTLLNANANGNIHVPYSDYNRLLFKALMRHAHVLGRRGLPRTALECLKLLYSLNADDPSGVLATVDYYALRCREFAWLRAVAKGVAQASTMPNIVYSLALAAHLDGSSKVSEGSEGSEAIAIADADDLMAKALMMFPGVVVCLQRKLAAMDVPMSEDWAMVLVNDFFAASADGLADTPSLRKLVDIFVERSHSLWKPPPVQEFMLRAAERVASLVNTSPDMQRESLPLGLTVDEWKSVGDEAFAGGDDAFAHLKVHDFSDAIAAINPEELDALQGGVGEEEEALMMDVMAGVDDLGDAGPLAAFLRTLLPWVNAGVAPGDDEEREEEREEETE